MSNVKTVSLRFVVTVVGSVWMTGCGADSHGSAELGEVSEPTSREGAELQADATYDLAFEAAAKEFAIPAATLKATAWALTRYQMISSEPHVDGEEGGPTPDRRHGLMAVPEPVALAMAAQLGVTVDAVQDDPATNIRAAAAAMSKRAGELGVERGQLMSWGVVVAEYAGVTGFELRQRFIQADYLGALAGGLGRLTEGLRATAEGAKIEALVGEQATLQQGLTRAPDFGAGIWRPSPNFRARSGGHKPQLVVIHTCEGSYASCQSTFINGSTSAHYVVNTNGEVTQMVRESDRASHISAVYDCVRNSQRRCELTGVPSNDITVGIEHAGFASQRTFPSEQLGESTKLVCDIAKRWKIPADRFHVVGHGQLQPWNRTDPGANWPWASYVAQIAACAQTTTTPTPPGTGEIIIDSNNANNDSTKARIEVSANWASSTNVSGFFGTGYFVAGTNAVSDGASFWFFAQAAGPRSIDAWWSAASDRSTSATYVAFNAAGVRVGEGAVNQTINGGRWNQVGTFNFSAGWNRVLLSRWGAPGAAVVVADALRVR